MDMATFQRETQRHREYYESHRDQIRRECAGKYIVLANGGLFSVNSTADEAKKAVDSSIPASEYFLIFPAEMEPPFDLAYDLNGLSVYASS